MTFENPFIACLGDNMCKPLEAYSKRGGPFLYMNVQDSLHCNVRRSYCSQPLSSSSASLSKAVKESISFFCVILIDRADIGSNKIC